MSKVLEFQQQLLSDPDTREAFADNPGKFLKELGVELPANVKVPSSIPIEDLEEQVRQVQAALNEEKLDLKQVNPGDPASVTRFIEEAIPVRSKDLRLARTVHQDALSRIGGRSPAEVATIAVVGAVVAAVVAVPVAVFGVAAREFAQLAKTARGVEGITRTGAGFVLHGPNGVRVEGLDASGVVNIIKGLR